MIAVERSTRIKLTQQLSHGVHRDRLAVTVAGRLRGWAVHDEPESCQAASGTRAPVIYRSETQGKSE
jgi:hypothetical protein